MACIEFDAEECCVAPGRKFLAPHDLERRSNFMRFRDFDADETPKPCGVKRFVARRDPQ
jgi:hypothetical protein